MARPEAESLGAADRARQWLPAIRRRAAVLVLAAVVAVAAGLRAWAATRIHGPWLVDETIYTQLARNLWRDGRLEVLQGPTGFYSLLYPAFAGIPLTIGGIASGAEALRILQAVVVSLAAVPVYLWARSLAHRWAALVAAALAVAPAGLAFSGMIMTEALYYPLLALACWAIARALARPGRGSTTAVVAAVLACCATRSQAIVLVPALVTAGGLMAVAERRLEPLRRIAAPTAALAALAVAWVAWRLATNRPLLGAYEAARSGSYGVGTTLRFIVHHLGDLVLVTGVVPALATAVVVVRVLAGRERSLEVRAYAATAAAVIAWVVVQVGVFAAGQIGYLTERNLFTVAPVLFVGLAAWFGSGLPRPRLATAAVVAAAVAVCATLPFGLLLAPEALPYSPSSVLLSRLLSGSSEAWRVIAVAVGVGLVGLLFAVLPRRAALVLPVLAIAALAAASVDASRFFAEQAAVQQQRFLGPQPRWIDRAAHGDVLYLYDGDHDWDAVWAQIYWNERIREVVDLPGPKIVGPLPQDDVDIRNDGLIVRAYSGAPVREPYAVGATSFEFFGAPVAGIVQSLPGQTGLRLWKLDGAPRVSTWRGGFEPNGDVLGPGKSAWLTAYDCSGGDLRLTLISKADQQVVLRHGGQRWRTLRLKPAEIWRGAVPGVPQGRPGRRLCTFAIQPSGLLGTTVILFERR